MQNQTINTSPISQFLQYVKSAELSQSKEVKIPIAQARLIVITMTEMLDKMHQDYEVMFNMLKNSKDNEVISVTMDGGDFKA